MSHRVANNEYDPSENQLVPHLLDRLKVVCGEREVLGPPQLVHHAAVVEVGCQHLQQPDQLEGVLLQVERDGLVIHLLVSHLQESERPIQTENTVYVV